MHLRSGKVFHTKVSPWRKLSWAMWFPTPPPRVNQQGKVQLQSKYKTPKGNESIGLWDSTLIYIRGWVMCQIAPISWKAWHVPVTQSYLQSSCVCLFLWDEMQHVQEVVQNWTCWASTDSILKMHLCQRVIPTSSGKVYTAFKSRSGSTLKPLSLKVWYYLDAFTQGICMSSRA